MKKSIIAIIIFIICSSFENKGYQTECISINVDGSITVKVWSPSSGSRYKIEQAGRDAVHALLFAGTASTSSCPGQKPLLQSAKDIDNFATIEKEFFKSNGPYLIYILSSDPEASLPDTIGPKEWKIYKITIAKEALRKYLEEKGIIKPLNSIF